MGKNSTQRLIYLEAARGLASIMVIFHHLSLAFVPDVLERFPGGIERTPVFALVNGGVAVKFFFILSGFVLSLGLMRQPSVDLLVTASVKRLPRLALPAGLSILAGFFILASGLNFYSEAAGLSHSTWLAGFAGANIPQVHFTWLSAIKQSIAVFIVPDNFYYNSNLWTMRPEFLGSLLTFVVAYAAGRWINRSNIVYAALMALIGCGILLVSTENLLPFVLGAILAYAWLNYPIKVPSAYLAVMTVLSFGLMCITNSLANLVAAALLLFVLTQSSLAERILSTRAGYWLGKFSFPIYLVHALIICTIGSFFYIFSFNVWHSAWISVVVAALMTFVATFIAAIPFVMLDDWWVPTLNELVKRGRTLQLKSRRA